MHTAWSDRFCGVSCRVSANWPPSCVRLFCPLSRVQTLLIVPLPNTDPDSRIFSALGDSVHRPGRWLLPWSVPLLPPSLANASHPDTDDPTPAALSYGYCYTIAIASEVSAASVIVSYWTDISPALVISIGLALILFINLMPIRLCVHASPAHRILTDLALKQLRRSRGCFGHCQDHLLPRVDLHFARYHSRWRAEPRADRLPVLEQPRPVDRL